MSAGGLITFGETMGLIVQTAVGPARNGEAMTFGMGGSESNVAIGVRRLGVPATWVGRVGDDPPGRLIARELRAEQVDAKVIADPAATGLMTRWRTSAGRSRVVYHRRDSAGSHLRPADIPAQAVADAAVLHVSGITLALGDEPAATVTHALTLARPADTIVSFDLNHRRTLWTDDDAAAAYAAVLPGCDVVFAGADEARIATGESDPARAARALEAMGPRQVLVTLGADGCLARIDGTAYEVAAPPVPVLDTVGAGDAFVAGYLAELIAGAPIPQRLATAVTAGALAVGVSGDWEGLPDRDALAALHVSEPVVR